MSGRDDIIGKEPLIPARHKQRNEIIADNIATGVSNSPYKGDYQHEKVINSGSGQSISSSNSDRSVITPKGTGINIIESDGAETVSLAHFSGSGVQINPDGSVTISSSSKKGIALGSNRGDVTLQGASVNIDAQGGISIKTNGSLVLDVGQDIIFRAGGSLITQTGQKHELINGSSVSEVAKDATQIIGGMYRNTIAGDKREQVTGKSITDTGSDHIVRSSGDMLITSEGTQSISSKGNQKVTSTGEQTLTSDGNQKVQSGSKTTVASTSVEIEGNNVGLESSGTLNIGSTGAMNIGSSSAVSVNGSTLGLGGTTVSLNTPTVNGPIPNDSPGSPGSPPSVSVGSLDSADEVSAAEVAEANDIIDEISSIRQIPEYPGNAKYETAEYGSIGIVSHDVSPEAQKAYDMYSSKNRGSLTPISTGSYGEFSGDAFNDFEVASNIKSREVVGDIPTSQYDNNSSVSGVKLAELVSAPFSHAIPPSKKDQVLAAHAVVMQNIIAPLRAQGFNFIITSAYRNNSKNHVTGYAIDLQAPGRIFSSHVAIAKYAAENLPCSQVFLERSSSGYTHVHLRAHPPGQSGSPSLLTCGDPRCSSKVSGIQSEWLRRKVRG